MPSLQSLLAYALLLGASTSATVKHRLQTPASNAFAQAESGTSHSC